MKKKALVVSILFGIFLISIVSAGLLDYFGRITGSVTVEGPVFYAGNPNSLTINEFEDSGGNYLISGYEEVRFITDELEEMSFYAPKLKLSVEAFIFDGTQPKLLDLEFGYYDKFVDGTSYSFCKVTINVTSDSPEVYSDICDGVPANKLESFYYSIKGRGTGDVKIKVDTGDQNTKVEVIGVTS